MEYLVALGLWESGERDGVMIEKGTRARGPGFDTYLHRVDSKMCTNHKAPLTQALTVTGFPILQKCPP